jgi:hypothetical protein
MDFSSQVAMYCDFETCLATTAVCNHLYTFVVDVAICTLLYFVAIVSVARPRVARL